MFWVSCRGVGKPVLSKLAWPHRNDAARVSVPLQQIERIEVQSTVEKQFDVVQEQQSLPGSLVAQVIQQVRGLEVATRARYCEQLSSERSGHVQNGRIPAFGQLCEKPTLSGSWWTDQQYQLAVQARDVVNQILKLLDHASVYYPRSGFRGRRPCNQFGAVRRLDLLIPGASCSGIGVKGGIGLAGDVVGPDVAKASRRPLALSDEFFMKGEHLHQLFPGR